MELEEVAILFPSGLCFRNPWRDLKIECFSTEEEEFKFICIQYTKILNSDFILINTIFCVKITSSALAVNATRELLKSILKTYHSEHESVSA